MPFFKYFDDLIASDSDQSEEQQAGSFGRTHRKTHRARVSEPLPAVRKHQLTRFELHHYASFVQASVNILRKGQ